MESKVNLEMIEENPLLKGMKVYQEPFDPDDPNFLDKLEDAIYFINIGKSQTRQLTFEVTRSYLDDGTTLRQFLSENILKQDRDSVIKKLGTEFTLDFPEYRQWFDEIKETVVYEADGKHKLREPSEERQIGNKIEKLIICVCPSFGGDIDERIKQLSRKAEICEKTSIDLPLLDDILYVEITNPTKGEVSSAYISNVAVSLDIRYLVEKPMTRPTPSEDFPERIPWLWEYDFDDPAVRSNDWLMTDPIAYANIKARVVHYKRADDSRLTLPDLKTDIRNSIRRLAPTWEDIDIEFGKEVQRLRYEGKIREMASHWWQSPFSTIFLGLGDADINVGGDRIGITKGQIVTWACRMKRDIAEQMGWDVTQNVHRGPFSAFTGLPQLCGEMDMAMMGTGKMEGMGWRRK